MHSPHERLPAPEATPHLARPARSPLARALWVGLGCVFVGVGAVGVVLPGLPTTPFLILAASCYLRSSQRLYDRLLASRVFGPLLRDFREGRGVPRGAKRLALGLMWGFVAFAVLLGIPAGWWPAKLAVLSAAVLGSVYLARLPVRAADDPAR